MAQRLVRTLCPHCKKKIETDVDQWGSLVKPYTTNTPKAIYEAEGCLECRQTGYLGRKGVYEMLPLSDDLKQQITDNFDLIKFRRLALKKGMQPLNLAGAQKVAKGLTTISEVLKVAPPRFDA
jgi:general secretion pathway protein E